MIHRIESVMFKRVSDSKSEPGILLNEGEMKIIDSKGNIVDKAYDYYRTYNFVIETQFFKNNN